MTALPVAGHHLYAGTPLPSAVGPPDARSKMRTLSTVPARYDRVDERTNRVKRLEKVARTTAAPPLDRQLVVRGSPNTATKLARTAERMASQSSYGGQPRYGFTVHVVAVVAPGDVDQLLRTAAYRTRYSYGRVEVAEVRGLGFRLLPTFADPDHYTLLIEPYTDERIGQLAELLTRRAEPNPHWLGRGSG